MDPPWIPGGAILLRAPESLAFTAGIAAASLGFHGRTVRRKCLGQGENHRKTIGIDGCMEFDGIYYPVVRLCLGQNAGIYEISMGFFLGIGWIFRRCCYPVVNGGSEKRSQGYELEFP